MSSSPPPTIKEEVVEKELDQHEVHDEAKAFEFEEPPPPPEGLEGQEEYAEGQEYTEGQEYIEGQEYAEGQGPEGLEEMLGGGIGEEGEYFEEHLEDQYGPPGDPGVYHHPDDPGHDPAEVGSKSMSCGSRSRSSRSRSYSRSRSRSLSRSRSRTGSSRSYSINSNSNSGWDDDDEGIRMKRRRLSKLLAPKSSSEEEEDSPIILSDTDETDSTEDEESKPTVSSATLKTAIEELIDMYVEEETFAATKEIGRQLRWEELDILGVLSDTPTEYQIVEVPGTDIFGQPLSKKPNFECECPKCKRTLAAARFAPHLEKCMGLGRNSSRIATKRLTTLSSRDRGDRDHDVKSVASSSGNNGGELGSDLDLEEPNFSADEDDEEWTMERKRKKKGEKMSKHKSHKKGPIGRLKNESRNKRGLSPSIVNSDQSSSSALSALVLEANNPSNEFNPS